MFECPGGIFTTRFLFSFVSLFFYTYCICLLIFAECFIWTRIFLFCFICISYLARKMFVYHYGSQYSRTQFRSVFASLFLSLFRFVLRRNLCISIVNFRVGTVNFSMRGVWWYWWCIYLNEWIYMKKHNHMIKTITDTRDALTFVYWTKVTLKRVKNLLNSTDKIG